MIAGRIIVCVASNWCDHPTSKHHVMRILAERNRVLWVNYHASRRPQLNGTDLGLIRRRLRQVWGGPRRVQPTIEVVSPLLIPLPESRLARWVNTRLLAGQIQAALRRLPDWPVQLWLFTPDVPELVACLATERVVYYCVDDFAAFAGFNTALVEALEARTMRASDVVVTTSQRLYDERNRQHANVHFVPHGVDFEHFAQVAMLSGADVPDDIKHVPHPVFGYMGLISDYVDIDLIAQAARLRPEWSFVMIGDVRGEIDGLRGLSNVHVLGGRPYQVLPRYCRAFDVGLIPFRMSRLTRAVNPIKLREYLAAGLPVVSTPLPEVLRYAPAVQTAGTVTEFLTAAVTALNLARDGDGRARQELVRGEGWRTRVETLSEIVSAAERAGRVSAGRAVTVG